MVVLLPPLRVVIERLKTRGDEFQTIDTITKLYDIFEKEALKLQKQPNVFIYRSIDKGCENLADAILDYERKTYDDLAGTIASHVSASPANEQVNVRFAWSDKRFDQIDQKRLQFDKEVDYYNTTRLAFIKKIRNELDGLNEYSRPQSASSRRFILAQDSCISFVQALLRDDVLYMNVVCRSSEVCETFKHDIHFIGDLGRIAVTEIGDYVSHVSYTVTLGSAHIIR
jgi:hypothetical protein